MRAVCAKHGEQEFTVPNHNGDSFCTCCVAESVGRKLGAAIVDDLWWRKQVERFVRSQTGISQIPDDLLEKIR